MNFLKRRFFAVEPFGLFQILQSFLSQNPENAPQAEVPKASENAPQAEETMPTTNEAPHPLPQADSQIGDDSSNQAFLSFMQAHEKRAKRIKKL